MAKDVGSLGSVDLEALRWSADGLLPAVVQDANTRQVLMVAWVNRVSLERCLETSETWFWSRSRQCLWHKGATSGNIQRIHRVPGRLRCGYAADVGIAGGPGLPHRSC